MSWDKIIGQPRAKNILQRAIIEQRVSSAYLFHGTEGIGKSALALEFAKAVNCASPIVSGGGYEACDACPSCRSANSMQSPNISLIFALPAGKAASAKGDSAMAALSDDQIEEVQEQLRLKSEDPYHQIAVPGASQIKIASIREVKKNLSMAPPKDGRRFVIVIDADQMTTEAANSFLKTLEEPHENITIILVTARQDQILQTILSRSQQIMFPPLTETDISGALVRKRGISEANAKLIAAFAQGSYTKALEHFDSDMQGLRSDAVDMFRLSITKHNFRMPLIAKIDEVAKTKDRTRLEEIIGILQLWIRDAIIISRTGRADAIVNADQADALSRFANNFAEKDLSAVMDALEVAARQIPRNVSLQLIMLGMFMKIRQILLVG